MNERRKRRPVVEVKGPVGHGPVVLAYGFRPFFICAGVYAVLSMLIWIAWMGLHAEGGTLIYASTAFPALLWHAHEMFFGYGIAVVAGFLLTASANWAKEGPVAGWRLALLVLLWIAGRVAIAFGAALPPLVADIVDLAFVPALALALAGSLTRTESRGNLIFLPILTALFIGDLLIHLEIMGETQDTAFDGLTLAIGLFALLMTVLGGRVTPSFTQNALRAAGSDAAVRDPRVLGLAAIGLVALSLVFDLALPGSTTAGVVAALAAVAVAARVTGWQTLRISGQPILWVLHLGYLWIAVGMALKAAAILTDWIPPSAATHALTAGAIGTFTLGMMSRIALGHTGRALEVRPAIAAAYGLVTVAAIMRIAAPVLFPDVYLEAVAVAAGLWVIAFAVFTMNYWPILTQPRPDGKPG